MVIINFVDTNTQEVKEERHHVGKKTNTFLPNTLENYAQANHPCESNLSNSSKVSKTSIKNKLKSYHMNANISGSHYAFNLTNISDKII